MKGATRRKHMSCAVCTFARYGINGTGRDKPRSRQAIKIMEFLARTALGLKQVLKADEGISRTQAFKFLRASATSDGVEEEAPPAFLQAV
jgi:hypothetical protein